MTKSITFPILTCLLLVSTYGYSQTIQFEKASLEPVQVSMSIEKLSGKQVLKIIKDSTVKKVDEPTIVKLRGMDFKNGTIEVKVLSRLLKNAPEFARGFIGVAFRINDSNSHYESIYIRPTNGFERATLN
jgi:hypothetical protein